MAKKKNFWTSFFGDRISIWDLILIGLIAPYFYLQWIGFAPATGFERIYFNILGPTASIGVVVRFINMIRTKARKK